MKIKTFQLLCIFLMFCLITVAGSDIAFADAHETNAEMAEEKPPITGWFQVDVDSLGSYLLIGASHPVGGISIASNIYINDINKDKFTGEFDLGVTVPAVANDSLSLLIQPMVGIGFDYRNADNPDALYPQIFAFLTAGDIFFFHWTISTITSIFEEDTIDELYNRSYLTYSLNDTIAIGPQVESVLGLGEMGDLWAFNLGVRFNIGYGKSNTLGLYFGYETQKDEEETGLTGRMNFTRYW